MPGDKSISHRAALFAAIANGHSTIEGFASSADCESTLRCIRALGVDVERSDSMVTIYGTGSHLKPSGDVLDCGNSGTTMRLIAGILAGQDFVSTITGDDSLRSRPMGRVIKPLELMGAEISSIGERAPLVINGRYPLSPITYETPVASAQVKSCVLLAGLFADGVTEVVEKTATRDHTERLLEWLGVTIEAGPDRADATHVVSVKGPAKPEARPISVPGDISSAAFFLVAASLLPDSILIIENVGLNPTRSQIISTLCSFGVKIKIVDRFDFSNEPAGNIQVESSQWLNPSSGTTAVVEGDVIPGLIDEIPILAVLGTRMEGGLKISDAAELRVKESDRIATTVKNLRAMGAIVEESADGFFVNGPVQLHGAAIETHGDHRIAMAFSIAALIADGNTEIDDAECAAVSFPNFFEVLDQIR